MAICETANHGREPEMFQYECWIVALHERTGEMIIASSSFEARRQKAAKHTGCEITDVVARRIRD